MQKQSFHLFSVFIRPGAQGFNLLIFIRFNNIIKLCMFFSLLIMNKVNSFQYSKVNTDIGLNLLNSKVDKMKK